MSDDLVETAVNWDHDTGEIVISTRKRSVISKLKKLGLKPDRDGGPHGYSTFYTNDKEFIVGFRNRNKRKLTKAHLEKLQKGRVRAKAEEA